MDGVTTILVLQYWIQQSMWVDGSNSKRDLLKTYPGGLLWVSVVSTIYSLRRIYYDSVIGALGIPTTISKFDSRLVGFLFKLYGAIMFPFLSQCEYHWL